MNYKCGGRGRKGLTPLWMERAEVFEKTKPRSHILTVKNPKRQGAGALHNALALYEAREPRVSVLECGGRGRKGLTPLWMERAEVFEITKPRSHILTVKNPKRQGAGALHNALALYGVPVRVRPSIKRLNS
jgi:hypothetical protein